MSINFFRLENLIHAFAGRVKDRVFWWTPFSIAISLLFTLVVSEFKMSFAGLSAEQWRLLALLGLAAASVTTIIAVVRAVRGQDLDALMDTICAESISRPRHYGITLFKAADARGVARLLVYHDEVWDCYLLPYVRLHEDQSDPEDVSEPAADRFSLSKDALSARELDDHVLVSEKISAATGKMTNYRFAFYIMKVAAGHATPFRRREFEVQSRNYKWVTIEEALANPKSADKNGDVFRYLRDHYRAIFQDDRIPNAIDAVIR
ncbi:hypothetical protein FHS95_003766 [Sphingomonas naasensis]|uniref:Uncharacterized protein n=1 Tax=Sphingomonas naasensis TaxID=1344951 RepID=A0A4S1WGP1_9SPHN|nr:hypothetical protein [Sphingomonas naasensis]NIJ22055.1 hypothetical protein [Sphingomonas naasensis]TGX42271.1 hypothetical protein E5A74_10470 [Sphingomonas naasensis]